MKNLFVIPDTVRDTDGKVTIKETEPGPKLRDYVKPGPVYTGPARDKAIQKAIDFINGLYNGPIYPGRKGTL